MLIGNITSVKVKLGTIPSRVVSSVLRYCELSITCLCNRK